MHRFPKLLLLALSMLFTDLVDRCSIQGIAELAHENENERI